jgi:hypothetical protein
MRFRVPSVAECRPLPNRSHLNRSDFQVARPEWSFLDSKDFAFSSVRRREGLSPLPARLIKYVNMRIPDCGPFGETLLEARVLAIVEAPLVNRPRGGCVESVLTFATHRCRFLLPIVLH